MTEPRFARALDALHRAAPGCAADLLDAMVHLDDERPDLAAAAINAALSGDCTSEAREALREAIQALGGNARS